MITMSSLILVSSAFYIFFILQTLAQPLHDHQTETKKNKVLVPVLASAVGLFGVLLIAAIIYIAMKSKRKRRNNSQLYPIETEQRRRFSYDEVVKLTDNFERQIGAGGSGTVYYGNLDGFPVAVKVYREGHRDFTTEVNCLSKIHHNNLVNLIGYCNEEIRPALIFEYMANSDLSRNLTGGINSTILSWEHRLKIAIGVAKGLDYLHDGCKPALIHRDVTSSNILMSENLEAKLSGFSQVTSLSNDDDSHVSTAIVGTPGYLDPEYYCTNMVTTKSDVYSFGVVLLEIITSQPALLRLNTEEPYRHLTEWVSSMFAQGEEVEGIVDQILEGDFDICSADEALKIAMACASRNSGDRPTMGQVVVKLTECLQMESARLNTGTSFDPTTSNIANIV